VVVDNKATIGEVAIADERHERPRNRVHLILGVEERVQELRPDDDLVADVTWGKNARP